jgi:hypothetical protein
MQRVMLSRVDDTRRRNHFVAAREIIYKEQYIVNSKAVDNLLYEESLVPTIVGYDFIIY